MSQSVEPGRSRTSTIAWFVVGAIVVVAIIFIGGRIGRDLLGPGPLARLTGDLQQVQTSAGTYVGRITSSERSYLVLSEPAVVTAVTDADGAPTGEFVVQPLAGDPFGLSGPAVVNEEQVIFAGDVSPDSQLADAYREAMGSGAGASPTP